MRRNARASPSRHNVVLYTAWDRVPRRQRRGLVEPQHQNIMCDDIYVWRCLEASGTNWSIPGCPHDGIGRVNGRTRYPLRDYRKVVEIYIAGPNLKRPRSITRFLLCSPPTHPWWHPTCGSLRNISHYHVHICTAELRMKAKTTFLLSKSKIAERQQPFYKRLSHQKLTVTING